MQPQSGRASRRLRDLIAGILIALSAVSFADAAHAETDAQAWGAAVASGAVRGDLFVWIEGQTRLTDDIGGGSQLIFRPAIGARIAPDAHAVAGYAYIRNDPDGGALTHEHRLWQQVQFVPIRRGNGAPLVISRTRLEQRMIEGRSDTGWRLRQFVRVQAPMSSRSAIQAVAFTEGFFNLNATSAGARSGVDQWRTFVGVAIPLTKQLRVEPGYLNQYVVRRGDDRVNQVLSTTLFITL